MQHALLDPCCESGSETLEAVRDVALELVGRCRRGRSRAGRSNRWLGRLQLDTVDGDLVDPLRLVDSAQVPLSEREDRHACGEARPDERPRGLGEKDLAAPTDGADARCPHHVESDVSLLVDRGLSRMQADPHTNGDTGRPLGGGMCPLGVDRSRESVPRTREDEEERVSLCIHLDTVASRKRVTDDPPVAGEHLAVVVAQPFQELRRVLDVGEDERDGACGQVGHVAIVVGELSNATAACDFVRRARRGG
jgi:hypothetical protein